MKETEKSLAREAVLSSCHYDDIDVDDIEQIVEGDDYDYSVLVSSSSGEMRYDDVRNSNHGNLRFSADGDASVYWQGFKDGMLWFGVDVDV